MVHLSPWIPFKVSSGMCVHLLRLFLSRPHPSHSRNINELSSPPDRRCVTEMCPWHWEQTQGAGMCCELDLHMRLSCWWMGLWIKCNLYVGFDPQAGFFFIRSDGATCLFAPVPWWCTLWLDVVYGCSAVWRGGHLEECCTILMLSGWNITALSLDCCVRCFSPIHKNAISMQLCAQLDEINYDTPERQI